MYPHGMPMHGQVHPVHPHGPVHHHPPPMQPGMHGPMHPGMHGPMQPGMGYPHY